MPNYIFGLTRIWICILASFVIMIVAVPFMSIPVAISLVLFCFIKVKISSKIQYLQWFESECRAPLNTKFGSATDGLMTIRAYDKEHYFVDNFVKDSNKLLNISFTYYGLWMYLRQLTDFIGFSISSLNIILIVFFKLHISIGFK